MIIPSIKLRMSEEQHARLYRHLFPGDGFEAVALAICGTRAGVESHIYCVHEIFEIPLDACSLRSSIAVRWNVQLLVPVLERALKRGLCILKIHSHPDRVEQFSIQDDESDRAIVSTVESILGRSPALITAFMTPGGEVHARRVSVARDFEPAMQVTVVGDAVKFMRPSIGKFDDEADLRTRQAFGERTVNTLRTLSIGVVGCSGTGGWVIELLGRLGVGKLVIVDPDVVERKNLNRIVNTTAEDVALRRHKVEVLADAVRKMDFGTLVEKHASDLAHEQVIHALADCDFLFGCMDSADGRDILNRIATYYHVPYIDVGVRLDADGKGGVNQICCAAHYLLPGGSSLLSRGVITADQVQAQAMLRSNPDQYAALKKEGYIKGIAVDRPAVASINCFVASHAVNEMLARVHPFRRDPGEEFRYQLFSLSDGVWMRIEDKAPCKVLSKHVGRGDTLPLLGNPALS
jgi:hypothetical protein